MEEREFRMKISRFLVAATVFSFALFAFGDAANMLISFATPGPDKYADGATVLDGEWYALVWSADGNFNGITPECTAVDPNDRVVIVAPLAKGGKCPFTVFQIDSQSVNYKTSGTYAVYLLDTRNGAKTSVAAAVAGKPVSVNGVQASEQYTAKAATAGSVEPQGAASGAWGESVVAGEVKQPKITAFAVKGAKVSITVDDLLPAVKYNVKMGKSPDKLDTYSIELPKEGVTSANFEIDAGDAKFFQVVREPLVKEAK